MWCGVAWLHAKHMSAITNLRHEALRDVADADGEPWYRKRYSETHYQLISRVACLMVKEYHVGYSP